MKILVFSDSHGNTAPMSEAVKLLKPELIIHLGDHVRDADCFASENIPLRLVRGNCDYGSDERETDTLMLPGGIRIVMTHGHRYSVKLGLGALKNMGRSAGADAVLFGHTHRALSERDGKMLLLNPGTAGSGRNLTCGVLHIEGSVVEGEVIKL